MTAGDDILQAAVRSSLTSVETHARSCPRSCKILFRNNQETIAHHHGTVGTASLVSHNVAAMHHTSVCTKMVDAESPMGWPCASDQPARTASVPPAVDACKSRLYERGTCTFKSSMEPLDGLSTLFNLWDLGRRMYAA